MFHTKSDVKINQYVNFNHLVLELSDTTVDNFSAPKKRKLK